MAKTENKLSGAKNNAAYSKRRSGGYRRSYRRSRFNFSGFSWDFRLDLLFIKPLLLFLFFLNMGEFC